MSALERSTTSSLAEKEHNGSRAPSVRDVENVLPNTLEKKTTTRSNHPLENAGEIPTAQYNGFQWLLVCFAMYSAAFLYGLDNTIVADIQPAIIERFGDISKLAWIGVGFPLGSIASILPIGKAFGMFDVKWLYVASLVHFAAGSALCGAAPNMDALIIGRVWAGAGGAGMYLGVLNIIALNTTIQQRSLYVALCGLVWGIGSILGPVIGGAFADSSATWRWAFYLNLVIFAVCSPIYLFVLKPFNPEPQTSIGVKLKQLDWVGLTLNAGQYVAFVMAFTFGGSQWTWSNGRIIALIVVWVVLLGLFAIQQTFSIFTTPERRLFPVDFLRSRTMILLYVTMSAACTSLFVPIYYIPLYFSFARGDTAIDAAVRLLPFIILAIVAVMLNGALMPKFGYYMPWYVVSGVFITIGGALMYSLVDSTTPTSNVYGYSVILGIGTGLAQQSSYSIAQAKVPMHRIADAVNFINSAQIGSIVIALAITGSMFQNIGFQKISEALEGQGFSEAEIRSALAGARSAIFERVTPETRDKVIAAVVATISENYIIVLTAGAVLFVSSLFMKREKLFLEISAGG